MLSFICKCCGFNLLHGFRDSTKTLSYYSCEAIHHLPQFAQRLQILQRAGTIYQYPPFFFQVSAASPEVTSAVLQRLTDRGKVPEALRLAHLIGATVVKGESGKSA